MKKFVMMIGLPASGKDTYLDEIVKHNEYVVSTDIIRQEIFKDVKDQSHNKEVFEIALNSCIGLLKKENVETVYFNATNINRKVLANVIIKCFIILKIRLKEKYISRRLL